MSDPARGDRSDRLEALFDAALEMEPGKRNDFLEAECVGDEMLLAQLRSLLAAHDAAGDGFLESESHFEPEIQERMKALNPEKPGDRIGPYKLLQQIGEGGFGTVWMAEQRTPIRRRVALKIIKPGMDSKEVIARFEQERQALAIMDHPCIARVYDAGTTCWGRPYFVMELVRGKRITEFCDEVSMSTAERLGLFIKVCHAVQHAHQKGVIHRDLKPSNILVSIQDGEPEPKIIDFGVAKAMQQPLTEKTLFTRFEQMVGTPLYMSPEQAAGDLDIDTRADTYALGVLLYELLTGRPPFDPDTLMNAGFDEMRRVIREEEPRRPSTVLSTMDKTLLGTVAQHRRSESPKLAGSIRGDLDWIVMKALEKDRRRRYPTTGDLAADVRRHLAHEPVEAGPPSPLYRFRKLLRRHRGKAIAAGFVFLTAVVGLAGIFWNWRKAAAARDSSALSEARALREWRRAEDSLYVAHMLVAKNQFEAGLLGGFRDLLARHVPGTNAHDPRGWEWYYLNSLLHREIVKFGDGSTPFRSIDWKPREAILASGDDDGWVTVWNPATGDAVARWRGHKGRVNKVLWSPDGAFLASAGQDGFVRVWTPGENGARFSFNDFVDQVADIAWTVDGSAIASGGGDGVLRLRSGSNGEILGEVRFPHPITAIATHPMNPGIACGLGWGSKGEVHVFRIQPAGLELEYKLSTPERVVNVKWSPDGSTLAYSLRGNAGFVATVTGSEHQASYRSLHRGTPMGLSWSRDGRMIASGGTDEALQCWDVGASKSVRFMAGHTGAVTAVSWNAYAPWIASAGEDGYVRIWNATLERFPANSRLFYSWVTGVAWSPDGTKLVVASSMSQPKATVIDAGTLETVQTLKTNEKFLWDVAWSPDGRRVAGIGGDGVVRIWDAASGTEIGMHKMGWVGISVRWSLDSRFVVAVRHPDWQLRDEHCSVSVIDGSSAALVTSFEAPFVHRACWGGDDSAIYTCGADGRVLKWDWRAGRILATLVTSADPLVNLEWSPAHDRLAVTGENGRQLMLTGDGRLLWDITAQTSELQSVSWSPDGLRIAAVGSDGMLKIRDAANGEELIQLRSNDKECRVVAWSPDGRKIATGGYDNNLRVWDASAGYAGLRSDPARGLEPPRSRVIPPRPGEAVPEQIDLSRWYNGSMVSGWMPSSQSARRAEKNFLALEPGICRLGGADFDVRGVIQLGGLELPREEGFPERVDGIEIGAVARSLIFIHATGWSEPTGTRIGQYQVEYADGLAVSIPLEHGVNIGDWVCSRQIRTDLPSAKGVWYEINAFNARAATTYTRLYRFRWENPRAMIPIRSISFVSNMTRSAPFLMAINRE